MQLGLRAEVTPGTGSWVKSGAVARPNFTQAAAEPGNRISGHDGAMADLGRQRYVSITTYRRDGSPVATPVWVTASGGRLYVWTGARTGKARRIRRNPEVTVAPCTARGRLTAPAVPARAQVVALADRPEIWPLFLAKYGLQLRAIMWSGRVSRMLRRAPAPAERVLLELTITDPA
jgi:uncharacterized protein